MPTRKTSANSTGAVVTWTPLSAPTAGFNLDTRAIDLVYEIREEKVLLDSIKVEGNTKTKANVILRELALAPGDVFDLTRMESSRLRLMNTRFFEDVSMDDEETEVPGRRNMRITVKEARTGNLTFGAGFSSLEKAILFAEVTQGISTSFNWRTFFQGMVKSSASAPSWAPGVMSLSSMWKSPGFLNNVSLVGLSCIVGNLNSTILSLSDGQDLRSSCGRCSLKWLKAVSAII